MRNKMLSILIPTFNYNCTLLVKDLHLQAIDVGIPFEIIVAEDGNEESKRVYKIKFPVKENQEQEVPGILFYCKQLYL